MTHNIQVVTELIGLINKLYKGIKIVPALSPDFKSVLNKWVRKVALGKGLKVFLT